MKRRRLRKIWICNDVWMDIFPHFDRPELGLKMALLSPRFDCLVDKHFDGKTELTIWRPIIIRKDHRPNPRHANWTAFEEHRFPPPDRPLPYKMRFKKLRIDYIDYAMIAFLRSNKHIWDRIGTNLDLALYGYGYNGDDVQPVWHVFVREIWPIFAPNIRRLGLLNGDHLDNLRRLISPTILSDLNQLNCIHSHRLLPGVLLLIDGDDFDESNANSAGQVLSKWLHTPKKDGQSKQLFWGDFKGYEDFEWINNFKEIFVRARTSVSYAVHFTNTHMSMPIVPFELVNEQTNEKLTLKALKLNEHGGYDSFNDWLLKRCQIGGTAEAAVVRWKFEENLDANLNNVFFDLCAFRNCIGPLSETDKSNEKVFSSPAGPSSDQQKE